MLRRCRGVCVCVCVCVCVHMYVHAYVCMSVFVMMDSGINFSSAPTCIRVLMTSSGVFPNTLTAPAMAPNDPVMSGLMALLGSSPKNTNKIIHSPHTCCHATVGCNSHHSPPGGSNNPLFLACTIIVTHRPIYWPSNEIRSETHTLYDSGIQMTNTLRYAYFLSNNFRRDT